jgi:FkbM family methyltransferase
MQRYEIDSVIDIGANAGQYATLLRTSGYAGRIQSYEPLPDAFAQLCRRADGDPLWTPINQAVGNSAGTLTMHVAANSVSSSILEVAEVHRQAAPASASVATITVQSTGLDSVLAALDADSVMVKADTQGFELPILKSAGSLLHRVRLIEIEMSLTELYEGQALFREVDEFLLAQNFELKSIEEGFFDADTGELLQIDAIYGNRAHAAGSDQARDRRVSASDTL